MKIGKPAFAALLHVPAVILISAAAIPAAHAQSAPPAWVASPDVYQVVLETDKYRILRATWKPGQRDNPHSHKPLSVYFVDDCHVRLVEGGKSREAKPQEGRAVLQKPIQEHTFENIGTKVCRMILIEDK